MWSGTSVVTSYLIRHLRTPIEGARPIAALLVVVAAGQLTGYGLDASSSVWRLAVPMFVAGLATGSLNALLGREAVASVPPDRAAMGSGANNTARYLGAACGITLFVVIATHAGARPAGRLERRRPGGGRAHPARRCNHRVVGSRRGMMATWSTSTQP